MREMGLAGATLGRAWVTTTEAAPVSERPADLVDRQFTATRPNQLWLLDFTCAATWSGFVYLAFVIDIFRRRVVGWRVSSSLATDFVVDAPDQATYDRCTAATGDLVHHSDRGTYLSMRYSERLADAGIEPSVGSRGDSYDALAESVIGFFEYVYYRCTGFKGKCGNIYIRDERLSALLAEVVAQIRITEDVAEAIAETVRAAESDVDERRRGAWHQVDQRHRTVVSNIDRGYEDFIAGRISEAFWTRKSAEWETELQTMDAERTRLERPQGASVDDRR